MSQSLAAMYLHIIFIMSMCLYYASGTNVTHSYKSSENVLSWTAHLNPQMRYYDEYTRFVKKKNSKTYRFDYFSSIYHNTKHIT